MIDVDRQLRAVAELVVNAARVERRSRGDRSGWARGVLGEVLASMPAAGRREFTIELVLLLAASLGVAEDRMRVVEGTRAASGGSCK